MSDSDCSNCEKGPQECKFYDYSYSCHVNEIKSIKENFNKVEINKIKKTISLLKSKVDNVDWYDVEPDKLEDIVIMYEETIDE